MSLTLQLTKDCLFVRTRMSLSLFSSKPRTNRPSSLRNTQDAHISILGVSLSLRDWQEFGPVFFPSVYSSPVTSFCRHAKTNTPLPQEPPPEPQSAKQIITWLPQKNSPFSSSRPTFFNTSILPICGCNLSCLPANEQPQGLH